MAMRNPAPNNRPNIVLIVSDDHGYADRGALGYHSNVSTPALDRLAAQAVTCEEAYVTAPICSPSRAAIMSGRYQERWGAFWFESSSFAPQGPSLAERLRDQGYVTGYLGKVHYGQEEPGDRACPPGHGFDESFYGLAGGHQGRLHYLHHDRSTRERYGEVAARLMGVGPLWENGEAVEWEGFLTWELGRRARDFVARHRSQPFFLMLCFNAVHNFCWQLPAEELRLRGLPAHDDWSPARGAYGDWADDAIAPNLEHGREYYLAQLELMDAEIGKLMDELQRQGATDDTIVVYTTDNGGSTCNFGDNTPLRGTKYTLWEGGIRVPLLVRWPGGGLPSGVSRSGMVSTLDLTPTLLAAAGAPPSAWSGSDGVDQLPLLRAGAPSLRRTLHWHTGWSWAVRSGDWKLSYVDPGSIKAGAVRRAQHADVGRGLFLADLVEDRSESCDLTRSWPEVVRHLTREHDDWCADIGVPSSVPV